MQECDRVAYQRFRYTLWVVGTLSEGCRNLRQERVYCIWIQASLAGPLLAEHHVLKREPSYSRGAVCCDSIIMWRRSFCFRVGDLEKEVDMTLLNLR